MVIRIRQLQAFQAVARSGSITRAADLLGISQPAVSHLITKFSETVGFKLFERRSGQLLPTKESRFLLAEVDRLLDSLEHIQELTRDLPARMAGHLRIACLPGFATSHLPTVLSSFLADRPAVTVTLEPDRPERILEWVMGEQYDCGITDEFKEHPAVHAETVQIRTVCIFPDKHPFAKKNEIHPEDLVNEPVIHTRRDSEFFRSLKTVFDARGVGISTWIETRQFTAACMLVSQGKGVSIVSEIDARGFEGRGVQFRPFTPALTHNLCLLRPIHAAPSMITLEFLETFLESLSAYRVSD